MSIETIIADFELLEDWEDRYRYVIELGRELPPLPDELRSEANKVRGCASQVWLATSCTSSSGGDARLDIRGDSDAHIVKGLVAILLAFYSGHTAAEILASDANALFTRLGLAEHLTQQRSNGFASMVARIREDARRALAAGSAGAPSAS